MCYLSYDNQSSHEGYIDMEFKEIVSNPPSSELFDDIWLSADELFDAVIDGYYVEENVFIPKYMHEVFSSEGDLKQARVSKRLVKAWCKNVSDNGLDWKRNLITK